MAEREQAKEKHLATIREINFDLAEQLGSHPPKTIALAREILQQTANAGNEPGSLAWTLSKGLESRAFNAENLAQILPVLHQTVAAGHDPNPLAEMLKVGVGNKVFDAENLSSILNVLKQTATAGHDPHQLAITLRKGLEYKVFNAENLPQIMRVLQQTAVAGHNPRKLAWALNDGFSGKTFKKENLQGVLELALRHAEKGKDPFALASALQSERLPPTSENLQALKEAEPHVLHAYEFLHGLEDTEDHESVSAPIFKQVLDTYKTKLPQMGEKKYWQWIGLHAKELKANKTSVKP